MVRVLVLVELELVELELVELELVELQDYTSRFSHEPFLEDKPHTTHYFYFVVYLVDISVAYSKYLLFINLKHPIRR
jgi:hypothetical protein